MNKQKLPVDRWGEWYRGTERSKNNMRKRLWSYVKAGESNDPPRLDSILDGFPFLLDMCASGKLSFS